MAAAENGLQYRMVLSVLVKYQELSSCVEPKEETQDKIPALVLASECLDVWISVAHQQGHDFDFEHIADVVPLSSADQLLFDRSL